MLTIYKYKIFIIVEDFDNQKTILTKMTMTIVTAERLGQSKKIIFFAYTFVDRNVGVVPL